VTSKIGLFKFLEDTQASSLAAARAHPLAQALGGMARVLYELVAGVSGVDGEPPASGTNPQGLIGVDLSGPPWGPAIRHPIAAFAGLAATSNVVQPSPRLNPKNVAGGASLAGTGPWRVHNRPFDVIGGNVVEPYSRALIVVRAHKVGATNATVSVRWRNRTKSEPWSSGTISVTSTSETNFAFASTNFIALGSGDNVVEFLFEVTTSGAEIVVDSILLFQAVKLQH
jgi:hypothetical protein